MKKIIKVFLIVLGVFLVGFIVLAVLGAKDEKRENEKAESIILQDIAYSDTDVGYAELSREEKEEKLLEKHIEVTGIADKVSSLYLVFSEGDLSVKCYMDDIPENMKEGSEVVLHGACTYVGGDNIRLRKCIATSIKEPVEQKQPEEETVEKETETEKKEEPKKDLPDEKETQENAGSSDEKMEEVQGESNSSVEKEEDKSVSDKSEEEYSYSENLVLDYVINDSSLTPGTRVRDVINNGDFMMVNVYGSEEEGEGDYFVYLQYKVPTTGLVRATIWSFHIYNGLVTPYKVSLRKNGENYEGYEYLDYNMAEIIKECAPDLWIGETQW